MSEKRKNNKTKFLGIALSLYSINYGIFYLVHQGYMVQHAEPYMHFLPEKLIGYALVAVALIKFFGVITLNRPLKRVGIVLLTTLWGGLFFVALTYSFGTGSPNPIWIDKLLVLAICMRICFKGDFYSNEWK